jgi:hypothetical protein
MSVTKDKIKGEAMDKLKYYALSDADIQTILDPDTNIFTYPYLENVKHIDEVFDDHGRAMMLFLTKSQNAGHWIALIKKGKTIEFFDPYGTPPDKQQKWLSKRQLEELDQDKPLLTNLLKSSGYKIIYNKIPYQNDRDDINTCGRHAITRLLLKDLTPDEYKKLVFSSQVSPDEFVTMLTADILKK